MVPSTTIAVCPTKGLRISTDAVDPASRKATARFPVTA
jgi:hypothetical protein